jgi:hypothetical protein
LTIGELVTLMHLIRTKNIIKVYPVKLKILVGYNSRMIKKVLDHSINVSVSLRLRSNILDNDKPLSFTDLFTPPYPIYIYIYGPPRPVGVSSFPLRWLLSRVYFGISCYLRYVGGCHVIFIVGCCSGAVRGNICLLFIYWDNNYYYIYNYSLLFYFILFLLHDSFVNIYYNLYLIVFFIYIRKVYIYSPLF